MTTLEKIRIFERYLELTHNSSDQTIDVVLDKLLERKRVELSQQCDEMQAELAAFEQQYRLSSADFFDQFQRGQLGDATDFFEWSATWQMYGNTLRSLNILAAARPAGS